MEYHGVEILGNVSPDGTGAAILCCGAPVNMDDMEVVGSGAQHSLVGGATIQVYRPRLANNSDVYTFNSGGADGPAIWTRWTLPVNVRLTESPYRFGPSEFTFEAGQTVVLVLSSNREFHTFTIKELEISIDVSAGDTETGRFTFDRPGEFELICIPHRSLGMTGSITVR